MATSLGGEIWLTGVVMSIEDDPLIRRAETVMAEAAQLRQRLLEAQEQIRRQVQDMIRIEAELDPLLPHPPRELAEVRWLLAQETNS